MTLERIKEKLNDFNLNFKRNAGLLAGHIIIYNYIDFLKTEPYLKELLSPLFSYTKEQMGSLIDIVLDPEKEKALNELEFDILKPETVSSLPVFKTEFSYCQKAIENDENINLRVMLSVYLVSLETIVLGVQEIKDCQKSGDIKRANELIEQIKDDAFELMPAHGIKNMPEFKPMLSSQYLDICIEQINKHIIDHIDAQSMFSEEKPKSDLFFDNKKSLLYIKDYKIKISRSPELSLDHYILDVIFQNEDKDEDVYFKDVAKHMGEDYDKSEDWRKFYRACKLLNEKVQNDTDNKIINFIEFHGGNTAYCKINPDYSKY
jgi:hypothetical protein